MKKLLIICASILVLLFSCRLYSPDDVTSGYDSNPFLDVYDISENRIPSAPPISIDAVGDVAPADLVDGHYLKFAAITDVHIRRDRDTHVRYFHDNYYSFLDNGHYPFVLCLGDLTDDGKFSSDVGEFLDKNIEKATKKWFVYCIGNHERRNFDDQKWNTGTSGEEGSTTISSHYNISDTIAHYSYGNVLSIYKIDTTYRVIGKNQLKWLEEALSKDKAKYRMIITHNNITTGGAFDQSLFLLGLGNVQERNRLYRIMSEGGIGLVLDGHHHKGNIDYRISSTMGELNLAAYHEKCNDFLEL